MKKKKKKKNHLRCVYIVSINFSNKLEIFGPLTLNQNQEQNIQERATCEIDIKKIILPK